MNKIILILSLCTTLLFSNDIYTKIDPDVKKFLTNSEINYIKNKKQLLLLMNLIMSLWIL